MNVSLSDYRVSLHSFIYPIFLICTFIRGNVHISGWLLIKVLALYSLMQSLVVIRINRSSFILLTTATAHQIDTK